MRSKPGLLGWSGMSLGDTRVLPRWSPAWRWRELGPGFGVERVNLSFRADGDQWSVCGLRFVVGKESPKRRNRGGVEY
jgi:hypothetical protein